MLPSSTFNEEVAARIKAIDRRVRRLETLEEEGGGCLNLIEDIQLFAPAASITFSDIPQTYKHLWLLDDLLSTGSAGTGTARLRMNGDDGLSYTWIRFDMGTGANHVGRGANALVTEIQLRANTGRGGHHEINFLDYTATGKRRQALWKGGGGTMFFAGDPGDTFDDGLVLGRGTWENTVNAITSISISNALGNYGAGTRATLYGLC